jgi:hypothetical protein
MRSFTGEQWSEGLRALAALVVAGRSEQLAFALDEINRGKTSCCSLLLSYLSAASSASARTAAKTREQEHCVNG